MRIIISLLTITVFLFGCNVYKTHSLNIDSYSTKSSMQTNHNYVGLENSWVNSKEFDFNDIEVNEDTVSNRLTQGFSFVFDTAKLSKPIGLDSIDDTIEDPPPALFQTSDDTKVASREKNNSIKIDKKNELKRRGIISVLSSILLSAVGIFFSEYIWLLSPLLGMLFSWNIGFVLAALLFLLGAYWIFSGLNNENFERYIKIKAKLEKKFESIETRREIPKWLIISAIILLIAGVILAVIAAIYFLAFLFSGAFCFFC